MPKASDGKAQGKSQKRGEITREQMKNVLRKFRVALRKTDAETGQQGCHQNTKGCLYH